MHRAMPVASRESTRMIKMTIPATAPPDIFTGVAGATSGFTLTVSDKSATAVCDQNINHTCSIHSVIYTYTVMKKIWWGHADNPEISEQPLRACYIALFNKEYVCITDLTHYQFLLHHHNTCYTMYGQD